MFWTLYFLSIVNNVKSALDFTTILLVTALILGSIGTAITCGESMEIGAKVGKITCKIAIVTSLILFINTAIPDQKGVAMIIGGSATYEALQTPEAKEIGGKTLVLLNNKLDELLVEDKHKGDK